MWVPLYVHVRLIETEPVITLIGFKVGRTQDTAPSSPDRERDIQRRSVDQTACCSSLFLSLSLHAPPPPPPLYHFNLDIKMTLTWFSVSAQAYWMRWQSHSLFGAVTCYVPHQKPLQCCLTGYVLLFSLMCLSLSFLSNLVTYPFVILITNHLGFI